MPELAVIVPTLNERDNVVPLVNALERALAGVDFEVVFVDDDSPDGTAALVRSISRTNPRVRVIQRIERRGLASAVVEGMMSSPAAYLAVIDGDIQHDESVLPEMLRRIKSEPLDVVIGTRNQSGGSMGSFSATRVRLSNLGRRISSILCRAEVSDPMSGFFVVTREYLNEVVRSLSLIGFKVLLDLLASSSRPVRIAEVGYTFRDRQAGESKLTATVCLEYLELILDKLIGDWLPVRYAFFGMVGAIGVLIQFAVVAMLVGVPFLTAQAIASIVAMVPNFILNNLLTFRMRKLQGFEWVTGLLGFMLACSVGLVCNLSVAADLRQLGVHWIPASLAGILIGSVWNYGVSTVIIWRTRRRHRRQHGPKLEAKAVRMSG